MKLHLLVLSLFFLISPLCNVFAIDPATVKGSIQVSGKDVQISQGYAHLHDNAEGLLSRPKELRILLSDREVPQAALAGIAFLEVEQMAREGKVQGLLLRLDPAERNSVVVTVLYSSGNPGESLMTQSISETNNNILRKLEINGQRVIGEIEFSEPREDDSSEFPPLEYSIRFNVPLFNEPAITAELKGKAIQESPQVLVLRRKAEALAKGDLRAVQQLSSKSANNRNAALLQQTGPEGKAFLKQVSDGITDSLKKIQRVVVRGDRAVVIVAKDEWFTFVKEGAEWKADD